MRKENETMRKATVLLAAIALAVLLGALPAQADTTFTVNATTDASDADTTDGVCATAENQCTLRAAIEQANASAGDDVIGFAPSVRGTIALAGSELLIGSNLKVEGPGADVLSVSANNQSPVFHVQGGTVEISGLTITGGSGGGIYNAGTLTVSNSTITGNTSNWDGGGIYNFNGNLTVERSTISGNTAGWGGGIYSDTVSLAGSEGYPTSKTAITNSTISGNTARSGGGGVFNGMGLTEIEHSTITNNSAPANMGSGVATYSNAVDYVYERGLVYHHHRTDVYSSIISGNTNTDNTGTDVDSLLPEGELPPELSFINSFNSRGYNLIGDGNGTDGISFIDDKFGVEDPGLEPLSLNGGFTKTHALKANSPAINAGPLSTECSPPATDQRGVARAQQGRCDIGSFERDATAPRVKTVVPAENATGIAPGTNVSAGFNEPMRATSINQRTFKLYRKGSTTALDANVSYDATAKKAVLNPSANLQRGATYKVVVTTGAKDLAGNALDQTPSVTGNQQKVWFFTISQ
jgi:hypothetical protein